MPQNLPPGFQAGSAPSTNLPPGFQTGVAPPPAAPDTPWYDEHLHPETWFDDAKDADPNTFTGALRHVIHGGLQAAGVMTSPKNLALTAALVGANAIPGVGEAADAYALSSGLFGTGVAAKGIYDKVKTGDTAGAEEVGGQALPGVAGAIYGGQRFGQRLAPGSGISTPVTATLRGLGNVSNKIAEGQAEGALGITSADRAYGRTPGKAILQDTSGLTAEKVKESAQEALKERSEIQRDLATVHGNAGTTVSLDPALSLLNKAQNEAEVSNNPDLIAQIEKMTGQLSVDTNGIPIPTDVPPAQALSLLRGFRDQYADYRPNADKTAIATSTANKAAHELGDSITKSVPELNFIRQRVSSLIPVERRADITDRGAGIWQQVTDAMKAKTGALTGMIAGAGSGVATGHGLPGAVLGGLAGAVVPRLVASEPAQLFAARSFYNAGKGLNIAAPYVGDYALKLPTTLPYPFRKIEPPTPPDEDDQY